MVTIDYLVQRPYKYFLDTDLMGIRVLLLVSNAVMKRHDRMLSFFFPSIFLTNPQTHYIMITVSAIKNTLINICLQALKPSS